MNSLSKTQRNHCKDNNNENKSAQFSTCNEVNELSMKIEIVFLLELLQIFEQVVY